MARITKKGARQVTADLDGLANLFQNDWAALGIPMKIAHDFALRCDMLSDAVEKHAGLDREALSDYDPVNEATEIGGWDPEQIGEEQGGPQRKEPDEPYMNQQFSQQENRELRERQETRKLGPGVTQLQEDTPSPGVQASFQNLVARLRSTTLDADSAARVAKALSLVTKVVDREAGEVPPQFLKNQKGKDDEDKDDKKDDEKDDKKASRYNLYA